MAPVNDSVTVDNCDKSSSGDDGLGKGKKAGSNKASNDVPGILNNN